MNVESWCQVEANPKASWERANRKHFPKAMKSTVFVKELPDRFAYKLKPPKELLEEIPKLKHFPQKCEHIILVVEIEMLKISLQMIQHSGFDNRIGTELLLYY